MAKETTIEQMRNLLRLSAEFGHGQVQMFELAAYHLARFTTHRYPAHSHPNTLVVCGSGSNGTIGLITAKHLANASHNVAIFLKDPEVSGSNQAEYIDILKRMDIEFTNLLDTKKANVIVDSLIGLGLDGNLYDDTVTTIKHLNESGKPLISLEVPSGMNADTGEIQNVAVRPDHTVCVGAIKIGINDNSKAGVVHVYDIGIPRKLYSEAGLDYPF